MGQGFYGFPRILDIVRATSFKAIGKAGATGGAALAGGTASGAPVAPAGPFDVGDVVVGGDGTLWICTTAGSSQSSPGTFTQVIAGTVSGQLALAKGGTGLDASGVTDGQMLIGQSSDHTLALATLTAGSGMTITNAGHSITLAAAGAGGALTQIDQRVVAVPAASVAFSGIAGTYSHLEVVWQARCSNATAANTLLLQLNGDSGANYEYTSASVPGSGSTSSGQTSARIGAVNAASAPASVASAGRLLLPAYADTTFYQTYTASQLREDSAASPFWEQATGLWKSTAAVTALTIMPGAGDFVAGSTFTLYGLA